MRKLPVSIAFSRRILDRIDQEAKKQKRSRSEYIELHFEDLFFKEEKPAEIPIKLG
jgi:metal-responsive CopG/Arc/MetJ family transcriptional regulator